MSDHFDGLCAVLATPFTSSGDLDREGIEREVDFYKSHGAESLMALGVMGEGPALSRAEGVDVVRCVAQQAGADTPLVVGAVGMSCDDACAFGAQVVGAGASALMVTAPAESTDDVSAAVSYLRDIGSATGASIVLLDCPTIAPKLSVDDLVAICGEVEAFRAVKLEDDPTHLKIGELKARLGDRLTLFGANGAVRCLYELERGCDGFMTGYAYPEHLVEIVRHHRAGDRERAADAYARCLPLLTYCWQPGLGMALRKELLVHRGVIASAHVRPPNESVDAETRNELLRVVERVQRHALVG